MRNYLINKINELEQHPINSESYRNELKQYQEGLYVEDYEYERLKAIRFNEKEKALELLNTKIA
jgi:hypothetical protein